jgi:protein involved in polysaccharide export with SLBB domain
MREVSCRPVVCGFLLCLIMALAGCVSSGLRTEPYTPDLDRRVSQWQPWTLVGDTGTASVATNTSLMRVLRKGDRVEISLRNIPPPEQNISNTIDDLGEITLPYIGRVKLEGMTISEAEHFIRDRYITGQFFRNLDVILRTQEGEFYVDGEVSRKDGKYALTGDITLLRAISMAGGFTDFADRKNVKVTRAAGNAIEYFNCVRIAEGKLADPVIKTGDHITVAIDRW